MDKRIIVAATIMVALVLSMPRVEAAGSAQFMSYTGYMDSIDYYNVVGEMANTGNVSLRFMKVTATFYDSSNTVVGTSFTYALPDTLPPGRRGPFRLSLSDKTQSSKVHHYTVSGDFQSTTDLPQKLRIQGNSTYIDSIGYRHYLGEVKNQGSATAHYVKVIATCYNSTGGVVAMGWTYTSSTDIATNGTSGFDVDIPSYRVSLVKSYALTVDSNDYAMIPEYPVLFLALLPATLVLLALKVRRNLPSTSRNVTVTYSQG